MRWLLANRTLAALHSPSLDICRLRLRLRYANSIRATTSLLSSAAYSTARAQRIKATGPTRGKPSVAVGGKHGKNKKHVKAPAPAPAAAINRARGVAMVGGSQTKNKNKNQNKHGSSSHGGHSVERRNTPHKTDKNVLKKASNTNTRRSQRKEPPSVRLEFSEDELRQTIQIPTRAELPGMPSYVFENPREAIDNALHILQGTSSFQTEQMMHPETQTAYSRSTVTVQIPGRENLVAVGDGFTLKKSNSAASLHALAKMHEADLLTTPWAPVKVTKEEVQDEKDGILDVFNYAARYGCIPRHSIRRSGRSHIISIEMPEHDIRATVRVFGSMEKIEAAGAREFKRQAELYHLKKGTDSLVVKDSTALQAANASDFFEFCRDSGQDVGRVDVETNASRGRCVAKLVMGNVPQTEVETRTRRSAEKIAYLIGALSVAKENPQLLDEFRKALRAGNGRYLGRARTTDAVVSQESLQEMRALDKFVWRHGTNPDEGPIQYEQEPVRQMRRKLELTGHRLAEKSAKLQKRLEDYQKRTDLEQLRQTRSELPMSQYAPQVQKIVQDHVYCVIIGATGSGKTTQVPQILLDQAIENGTGASCNVICTQPRRIAATSVARRVANERAEMLQDTVGYHVRFDAKLPKPGGSIVYCTTGILLQQLQHAPDEVYDSVSHLVIDEVHERDMIIDFLLIILKKTMAARAAEGKRLPHVILMSATIDAERFAAYFKDSLPSDKPTDCPTLSVPGRTFPVKERYLENVLQDVKDAHGENGLRLLDLDKQTRQYLKAEHGGLDEGLVDADTNQESVIDWKNQAVTTGGNDALTDNKDDSLVPLGLAATTVAHIAKTTESGAILVFLPGLDEIVKLDEMLRVESPLGVNFNDAQRFQIFKLHSSIQDSQRTVFDSLPDGCRKIILSTNIAETSVTIPDVQFVVDTGKSREKRYDQMRRITQLQCTWISKSNAKQRAGRAGRVQNGNYYALFTRSRRESMRAIGLPELLRSDLQEICLDVKIQAFKMPVRDFLAEAIEPPSPSAVDTALRSLTALGALTEEEELTPLGRLLASLPVHPTLGKMIVLGIIFRCLDPMIILGAAAHERPLFVSPLDRKSQVDMTKKRFAGASHSDHIMLLNAFSLAREASHSGGQGAYNFFNRNFIHNGAFKSIDSTARQIEEILYEAKLIQTRNVEDTLQYGGRMLNQNSGSEAFIKALLVAGLYPNVALQTRREMFRTSAEKYTFVHPSSVNSATVENAGLLSFTSLSLSNDGSRMNLRDTTLVTPLMVLLFGGRLSRHGAVLEVDNWLPFYIKSDARGPMPFTRSDSRPATIDIAFFRTALDSMLAGAFNDLAKRELLADEPWRQTLASGLARILTREAGGRVPSESMYLSRPDGRGGQQLYVRHPASRQESRGRLDYREESRGRSSGPDSHRKSRKGRLNRGQHDALEWDAKRAAVAYQ